MINPIVIYFNCIERQTKKKQKKSKSTTKPCFSINAHDGTMQSDSKQEQKHFFANKKYKIRIRLRYQLGICYGYYHYTTTFFLVIVRRKLYTIVYYLKNKFSILYIHTRKLLKLRLNWLACISKNIIETLSWC